MNKKYVVIPTVLFLVVFVFVFWRWQSSPARQIAKTLETMAELGSSTSAESRISQALQVRKLVKYFTERAFIEWPGDELIPAGRWSGRESIAAQVLAAKSSATYNVSLADLTVRADRHSLRAAADFNLTVREGERIWAWSAAAQLIKDSGDWLVDQLRLAPILRP